jgi:hypothetical protein
MVNIIRALGRLAEFEDAISDLYIWLSEVYDDQPEVSGRFFQLGMQETRHSAMINYHRRLAMRGANSMTTVELDEVELDRLLTTVATLRKTKPRPPLTSVLTLAIETEVSAAERLHHVLARQHDSDIAKLGATLARDDERHSAMLAELERMIAGAVPSSPANRAAAAFNKGSSGFAMSGAV